MKKTLRVFFYLGLFCVSMKAFAELYKPYRLIELSVDNTASVSNNYFSPGDIFKKDLVIDLSKMAKNMPDSGFNINFNEKTMTELNVNVGRVCRVGVFSGVDAFGTATLDKSFFDFISGVNKRSYTVKAECDAEIYAVNGLKFMSFINGYGICVKPTVFVPLLYCPEIKGSAKYRDTDDGIRVDADATARIYTAFPGECIFEGDDFEFNSPMSGSGFCLEVSVETKIIPELDVGVFTTIPMVPGSLGYYTETGVTATGYVDNVLADKQDGREYADWDYETKDKEYGKDKIKLHRPMRFGAEAAFRPVGNWLTLRPELALVIRSPFSKYATCGLEYSLAGEIRALNIASIIHTTDYKNEVFSQRLDFMVNAHVLEIDFGIASTSGSFLNSFRFTGVTANFGIKMGF